jgi:riboflavin kinase/FMN adenylyltransferase
MKIIEWPEFLEETLPFGGKTSAITVGVFDGVHRGHKVLIERIVRHEGSVPAVITFRQSRYKKDRRLQEYPGDILSFRQKMAIFEDLGVHVVIVVEFSESFRRMSGAEFFRILLEHGRMSFLAVGSNFRCGYQLDTDAPLLREFTAEHNVPTDIVQPLTEASRPISSSELRSAIIRGKLKDAGIMLGRPFTVDLGGASVSRSACGITYDITGLGRVIPPPGKYQVVLKNDRLVKKPAEILIENGAIIVDDPDAHPEYVEF